MDANVQRRCIIEHKAPVFAARLFFFVSLSVACAQQAFAEQSLTWLITRDDLNRANTPLIELKSGTETVDRIPTESLRNLVSVYERIGEQAGFSGARLLVASGKTPNAYASRADDGTPIVVFTAGMMKLAGDDPDKLAAVMGHEFGHQVLGHHGAGGTTAAIELSTQILAAFLGRSHANDNVKTVGYLIGALGITAGIRSYDRDKERAADDFGVRNMIAAGFDPEGASRLWSDARMQGGGLFSTHPASDERLANVRNLAVQYAYLAPNYTYLSKIRPTPPLGSPANSAIAVALPKTNAFVGSLALPMVSDESPQNASATEPAAYRKVRCKMTDGQFKTTALLSCERAGGEPQ